MHNAPVVAQKKLTYDKKGRTALHRAVIKNDEFKFCQLLAEDIDVNTPDQKFQATALHCAAELGDSRYVFVDQLLKNRQINVNAQTKDGVTALYLAAQNNAPNIVERLCQAGCARNLNLKTTIRGATALHIAAFMGHTDIVQILLNHKAQAGIKTNKEETPADLANKQNIKTLLQEKQIQQQKTMQLNTPVKHKRKPSFFGSFSS